MKKIKILMVLILTATFFVSCFEDDTIDTVEPNHRVIVTSEMNFENTINPGGHIDFGDLSRGVTTRTWTFPEANTQIAGEDGNTSSKNLIKGLFYQPGVYNVTLNQTFKGDVYPNEDSTVPSTNRELDTTIVVTVLDWVESNLKAYYVNDDGSTGDELDLSDNAENEIIASKYVRLTYSAVGEPEEIVWSSAGGKPTSLETSDGVEVDMRFGKLGSWDLQYIASRTRPTDADTIFIKNFIKVLPSTEPVDLDRVFEKEGKIALEFSREMDPESLNRNNFTVRIENGGTTLNPAVSSAVIDSEEGNIVLLELENEQLYNDDQIFISYTPGSLRTLDLVDSEAFTDALLTEFTNLVNILPDTDFDYGFEGTDTSNWPYLWWGGHWGEFTHSVNLDNPRSGNYSLEVEYNARGGMIISHRDGDGNDLNFSVENGKSYEFGYYIYVEDLGWDLYGNMWNSDIRFYPSNWAFELIPTTFNEDFPTGKWVYQKQTFTATFTGDVTWLIRGYNEFNNAPIKFYLDDFILSEVPFRP
ncbi:hypothetical protein [Seonamhaeicola marinus]|uniref:PKD domain-containing protein n=1 Tax=Seonamhaeicola marinus TaxID=1912246 RepID=A0A5D0HRA9_9FLAO|nr:hypothetical protein [Seonamhaeicola marinus]TYA73903.1 hypothetical protein FUA24_11170 [Seonamhaeicola marinus]